MSVDAMIFQSIQYLRAAAALTIVAYHMEVELRRWGYAGYWPHGLIGGVDIFFVISGFIIWTATCGRPVSTLGFYQRRAERIVPLYWILTSVAVLAGFIVPHLVQSGGFDLVHVLASYCFLPAHHPVLHELEPVLIPGWTLNYEMFFYAVFGLTLALPLKGRLLATAAVLGGLVLLGWLIGAQPETVVGFYTHDIMLEFLMGMGLAALFATGWRIGAGIAASCLAVGVVAMLVTGEFGRGVPRIVALGVPALLIVGGALMLEGAGRVRNWPRLRLVGDASYSIYLTHAWVLSLVGQAWSRLHLDQLPGGWVGYIVAASVASVLAGLLLYRLVELPFQAVLRRRRGPGIATVPPAMLPTVSKG